VAFGHWSLPAGERTIVDWSSIDKLKLVVETQPIKSIEVLTSLFKFRWTVIGGLCLSIFENVKGESRTAKESVCDRNNAGVAAVIRRLNNIMISLMSISAIRMNLPYSPPSLQRMTRPSSSEGTK
jgi:hypothetical protein